VMAELENWSNQAQAGSGATDGPVGDPDFTPPHQDA
jgi:cyanophycin synthetase